MNARLSVAGLLQPGQHLVHGPGEAGDLVVPRRLGDPPPVLRVGDACHLGPDRLHRSQRPADHQPGEAGEHRGDHGHTDHQQVPQGGHGLRDHLEAGRDIDRDRSGRRARPFGPDPVVLEVPVVTDPADRARLPLAGPGAEREGGRPVGHVGAGPDDLAGAADDLHEPVVAHRGNRLRQPARCRQAHQGLGAGPGGLVLAAAQRRLQGGQQHPGRGAQGQQHDDGRGGGGPQPDRPAGLGQGRGHGSAAVRVEPVADQPRTVCRLARPNGSSIRDGAAAT